MNKSLSDITFAENGDVDIAQLNGLYQLIGWDDAKRRTEAETREMLRVSRYYIAAHSAEGILVGFARVCGDPVCSTTFGCHHAPRLPPPRDCSALHAGYLSAFAGLELRIRDLD